MTKTPEISIRPATWHHDAVLIRAVRQQVFVIEQNIPEELEFDGADANALHLLALHRKRDAVGTGRLEANGKIGRLAVVAAFRGRGLGSNLLIELVRTAGEAGLERVHLHAQLHALAFYERHGFVRRGDTFDEGGIEHVVASMDL